MNENDQIEGICRCAEVNGPGVSIIVLNYNGASILPQCMRRLLEQTYQDFEIVVVDNASRDGSRDSIAVMLADPRVFWVQADRNLGVAGGRNLGIRSARGEAVAFVDNDGYADRNWLEQGLKALYADKQIGAVSSLVLFRSNPLLLNGAGGTMNLQGYAGDLCFNAPRAETVLPSEVLYPMGCGMIVKKEVLDRIGPLDTALPKWFDDVELGIRIWQAGYRVVVAEQAVVEHDFQTSDGQIARADWKKALLFERARVRNAIKYPPSGGFQRWLGAELRFHAGLCLKKGLTAGFRHLVLGVLVWVWNLVHLCSALGFRRGIRGERRAVPDYLFDLSYGEFGSSWSGTKSTAVQ